MPATFCLRKNWSCLWLSLECQFAWACFKIIVTYFHGIQNTSVFVFPGLSVNGTLAILINYRISVFDFFHTVAQSKNCAAANVLPGVDDCIQSLSDHSCRL
jgi:hypothetical protein